ncbi:MAG: hypothetical protein IJ698_00260 [Prevotella sp.]|nr:hypothetical protein [Prevotella sp.]
MESKIRDCFIGLFLGLVVCVAISLLFGCASTKYVEVPKVHTEYVYKSDTLIKQDSIHIKDSVYVQMKGDTLLIEKWKTAYRDRWRVEVKVDSVAVTDTLTQVVKVEKELSHWQKTKLRCFPYLFAFFVGACLILFYRLWNKFR